MDAQGTAAARWWPRLSIESKHVILADLEAVLPEPVRREIAELAEGEPPERLTADDRQFIRTQVEAVD